MPGKAFTAFAPLQLLLPRIRNGDKIYCPAEDKMKDIFWHKHCFYFPPRWQETTCRTIFTLQFAAGSYSPLEKGNGSGPLSTECEAMRSQNSTLMS